MYGPAAQLLGIVRFPEPVANMAWGGGDFRTLFVTATTKVWSLQVQVPGLPVI